MDTESLIASLDAFPQESGRDFEKAAVQLAMVQGASTDILRQVITDSDATLERRYGAFFSLGTLLRRRRDNSALLDLIDHHREEFSQFGTFHHLEAMGLAATGRSQDRMLAMTCAQRAMEMLPNHPGVLHNFASILIQSIEDEPPADSSNALREAGDALNRAIRHDPLYAKFHAALARLEMMKGEYAEARRLVLRAIDLEESSSVDYHLRISDYNSLLGRILLRESQAQLSAQVAAARVDSEQLKDEMRRFVGEVQVRYLELLGFFSVVIGLIITGVQISSSMTVADAARTMLVVAGAILVAFAGLAAVINRPWRVAATFIGLGTVLIVLGLTAERLT